MNRLVVLLVFCNLAATIFLGRRLEKSQDQEAQKEFIWPEIEPDSAVKYDYEVELVRVIDGDTVVLNVDLGFEIWLHNQHVRLYGLDTLEV